MCLRVHAEDGEVVIDRLIAEQTSVEAVNFEVESEATSRD